MKRFRKGNALVLTTMILFAVSIIAAGLTMYFYYASIQNQNANLYAEKHVELENEFNKTYKIMLENTQLFEPDGPNLAVKAEGLHENEAYPFEHNGYKQKFEYVSSEGGVVTFTHTIETTKTMKSGRTREYSLVKTLTVELQSETYIFNILLEDYYVSTL